ncbi:MAG: putative acetyltransferase [Saprospiraceae bacterium]|jgi:putative acetyltransferase
MTKVTYSLANLSNLEEITSLFRDTIQTVNIKDYSLQEIEAWSLGADNTANWIRRIKTHHFVLAKIENKLVGMASVDDKGYLDVIYIHYLYQGMGVATSLLDQMIERSKFLGHTQITSDISITAKPFFIDKGFQIIEPQLVLCRGVVLRNYNVRLHIGDASDNNSNNNN